MAALALSQEKDKLQESLTHLFAEQSSSIEGLESKHMEEVKKLKSEIRQAMKMVRRAACGVQLGARETHPGEPCQKQRAVRNEHTEAAAS